MSDKHVVPDDGDWAVKRQGQPFPESKHPTQAEAIDHARTTIRAEGGGELTIHRPDGRIRERDTVPPKSDPFPPRG